MVIQDLGLLHNQSVQVAMQLHIVVVGLHLFITGKAALTQPDDLSDQVCVAFMVPQELALHNKGAFIDQEEQRSAYPVSRQMITFTLQFKVLSANRQIAVHAKWIKSPGKSYKKTCYMC